MRTTLAALGLLCAAQCTPAIESTPTNVLLVTFDTTRADHIGCYGYAQAQTPVLDGLASSGVLFENCIAVAPITLPTHASILTGLYPFHHGARNNATHYLPDEVETLAERLAAGGFETGAVVSSVVLDSRYGLDQGFTTYDDDLSHSDVPDGFHLRETLAEDTTRRALRWLDARSGERWFLWVHYFDAHSGYTPPEPFAARFSDSPYDGEIAYADAQLGVLLEELEERGALARTLVVATADHGESLREHGEATHGMFIYDATTRVPLIVSHPSLAAGTRVPRVVSQVDLTPTILELVGLPEPEKTDGASLALQLRGQALQLDARPAYSESLTPLFNHGWSDLRAARDQAGRYVRAPRQEVYDTSRDPGEVDNLFPSSPERAQPYVRWLAELLPEDEADVRAIAGAEMDEDLRSTMAALGYTWSEGELPGADGMRADPKDRIGLLRKVQDAKELAGMERFDQAETLLREVLEEAPASVDARDTLVFVLSAAGRRTEALELLREIEILAGTRFRNITLMAELERELGMDGWRERLQRAKELEPRNPEPWVREGDWALETGDLEAAEAAYRAALALDDRCAPAWLGLGHLEHRRQRHAEAEAALRRAVECDTAALAGWFNLGVVVLALDRPEAALEHFGRAARLAPEDVPTWLQIGRILFALDRRAEAVDAFERAIALDPTSLQAAFNLAVLHHDAGRDDEARKHLRAGCRSESDSVEAWLRALALSRTLEDPLTTIAAAERVLTIDGENVRALIAAALAEHFVGREDDARARMEEALRVDAARVEARAKKDPELARWLASWRAGG